MRESFRTPAAAEVPLRQAILELLERAGIDSTTNDKIMKLIAAAEARLWEAEHATAMQAAFGATEEDYLERERARRATPPLDHVWGYDEAGTW